MISALPLVVSWMVMFLGALYFKQPFTDVYLRTIGYNGSNLPFLRDFAPGSSAAPLPSSVGPTAEEYTTASSSQPIAGVFTTAADDLIAPAEANSSPSPSYLFFALTAILILALVALAIAFWQLYSLKEEQERLLAMSKENHEDTQKLETGVAELEKVFSLALEERHLTDQASPKGLQGLVWQASSNHSSDTVHEAIPAESIHKPALDTDTQPQASPDIEDRLIQGREEIQTSDSGKDMVHSDAALLQLNPKATAFEDGQPTDPIGDDHSSSADEVLSPPLAQLKSPLFKDEVATPEAASNKMSLSSIGAASGVRRAESELDDSKAAAQDTGTLGDTESAVSIPGLVSEDIEKSQKDIESEINELLTPSDTPSEEPVGTAVHEQSNAVQAALGNSNAEEPASTPKTRRRSTLINALRRPLSYINRDELVTTPSVRQPPAQNDYTKTQTRIQPPGFAIRPAARTQNLDFGQTPRLLRPNTTATQSRPGSSASSRPSSPALSVPDTQKSEASASSKPVSRLPRRAPKGGN